MTTLTAPEIFFAQTLFFSLPTGNLPTSSHLLSYGFRQLILTKAIPLYVVCSILESTKIQWRISFLLIIFPGPSPNNIFNMDSGNWRVRRDPSELPPPEPRTPMRSYQQRRNNDEKSSFGQSSGRGRFSSPGQSRDFLRKPLNNEMAEQAIEEGRRVYVGNMPYEVGSRLIGS